MPSQLTEHAMTSRRASHDLNARRSSGPEPEYATSSIQFGAPLPIRVPALRWLLYERRDA